MIRLCSNEVDSILAIINDGAEAYRGIIPADRFADPYMSREKLAHEIALGVTFWGYEQAGELLGVMGIQHIEDVTLIRHAYVRTRSQKQGVGAALLEHLRGLATGPVLIGTWAAADWAIRFYQRYGFEQVDAADKDRLLERYWTVPERQRETSIVLADPLWRQGNR